MSDDKECQPPRIIGDEYYKDLKRLVVLSDQFFEEVLPQAKHLVFQDYGAVNELGMLLTKLKKDPND